MGGPSIFDTDGHVLRTVCAAFQDSVVAETCKFRVTISADELIVKFNTCSR